LKGSGVPFSRKEIGAHRGRCAFAAVDRGHPAVARAVEDHEAASADPARERLGDAEDGGCDHRCVDGVATASQRVDGRLRREHVDRGRRASRSDRGRRAVQARIRQGADLGGERRHPGDEQDGERAKRTAAHDSPLLGVETNLLLCRAHLKASIERRTAAG